MSQRAHRDCKIGMIPLNGKRICSAFFIFHWIEKDRRRDKDNIAMAKKFILDSLQEWGVLKNDGWKQVLGFIDIFSVDKINPRVEVSLLTPEEFSRGIHVYPKKDTIHVNWEE
jgi:Holliday junction resolvase RusA-like endonuclease